MGSLGIHSMGMLISAPRALREVVIIHRKGMVARTAINVPNR